MRIKLVGRGGIDTDSGDLKRPHASRSRQAVRDGGLNSGQWPWFEAT